LIKRRRFIGAATVIKAKFWGIFNLDFDSFDAP